MWTASSAEPDHFEGWRPLPARRGPSLRIYFDAVGQGRRRFALDDILEIRETDLSPMPDNFAGLSPSDEFFQLLGLLLSQRERPAR
jgi:hypothetical protein